MNFRFAPIASWPRAYTPRRRRSQFRSGYTATIELLDRELTHLRAKDPIIQTEMKPEHIRYDGLPRANAPRPPRPGVIVSFESRHGPLSFACDAFLDWQDNLRAIAMTLERLRMADLYGVTRSGEQYRGWAAIEAPRTIATADQAAAFISEACDGKYSATGILDHAPVRREAYRLATSRLHPDAGGCHEDFIRLQQAYDLLSSIGSG